jgi:hypothetical protein
MEAFKKQSIPRHAVTRSIKNTNDVHTLNGYLPKSAQHVDIKADLVCTPPHSDEKSSRILTKAGILDRIHVKPDVTSIPQDLGIFLKKISSLGDRKS